MRGEGLTPLRATYLAGRGGGTDAGEENRTMVKCRRVGAISGTRYWLNKWEGTSTPIQNPPTPRRVEPCKL